MRPLLLAQDSSLVYHNNPCQLVEGKDMNLNATLFAQLVVFLF